MISNWNDYEIVNETLQKARSILTKLNIPEDNAKFQELRLMLSKNIGYLGKFTQWLFVDKHPIENLESLYLKVKGTKLPQSIDKYNTPEEVIDSIVRGSAETALNQMIQSIPSRTREFLKKAGDGCDTCYNNGVIECNDCEDGYIECKKCDGEGSTECTNCEGSGNVDCKKCKGEGCKDCNEDGYIECKKCDGEGSTECTNCEDGSIKCKKCDEDGQIECKDCKDGSPEWKKFVSFLTLQREKKDLVINFFSKKGGRYGDNYDEYEVLDFLTSDISQVLNMPSIDNIKKQSLSSDDIKFIFEDDECLIVAVNYKGIRKIGSSFWCIYEDEGTFDDYVDADSRHINVQLVLFMKDKSPLVDEKSVIGITYDVVGSRVTAAHWEDDSDAVNHVNKLLKSKDINNDNIFNCVPIYKHEDVEYLLLTRYPLKYVTKIRKMISDTKEIYLDDKIKKNKNGLSKTTNKFYEIHHILGSIIDDDYSDYVDFFRILRSEFIRQDFKLPLLNFNIHKEGLLDIITENDMVDLIILPKNWFEEIDLFDYLDGAASRHSGKLINLFKENGYNFKENMTEENISDYIGDLISADLVKSNDLFSKVEDWVYFDKSISSKRDSIYKDILKNNFDLIRNSSFFVIVNWLSDNINIFNMYKSQFIEGIKNNVYSKSEIDHLMDKIDDDDIDILAFRKVFPSRFSKKWDFDIKRKVNERLLTYNKFKKY